MPWTNLLAADRIVLLSGPTTREQVLDAAARVLGAGSAHVTPLIAAALREREAIGTTAIGRGVAIPHARSPMFHAARGAFLLLRPAVDFAAYDGAPVDLVFAMTSPDERPEFHLQMLSEIAEQFSAPGFRDSLRDAATLPELRERLLVPDRRPSAA